MKLCRYQTNDGIHLGALNLEETGLVRLSGLGISVDSLGDLIQGFPGRERVETALTGSGDDDLSAVELLAPVPQPTGRILCLGKNYRDHATEVQSLPGQASGVPTSPIYFGKMVNRIVGPAEAVEVDFSDGCELDYEVEMALIVGKEAKNLTKEEAASAVFAYTIVNDLTDRAAQRRHQQWLKGKSIDNTFPMGPYWVLADSVEFPPKRKIRSFVNGELRQEAETDDLLFSIAYILSDLSKNFTLMPGDLILTGTPAGVGMGFDPPKSLNSGDVVNCEIEGIGWLKNEIIGI